MCDVYHDRTYVFDITVDPPRQTETIVMKGGVAIKAEWEACLRRPTEGESTDSSAAY